MADTNVDRESSSSTTVAGGGEIRPGTKQPLQTSRPFANPRRQNPSLTCRGAAPRSPIAQYHASQTLARTMIRSTCVVEQESSSAAGEGGAETLREHIIMRPQDYIGSVDKCTRKMWVFEPTNQASTTSSLVHRAVTYVPGLYKIFDEVLIYAADNQQRDPSMDSLRVEVDAHQGSISIYYNGQGLPIELHPKEEGLYMPEMIFGHVGSSYDEELTAGGRNRYSGVKLANLFSSEFVIETVDSRLEKKYKQIFSENMGKKSEPQITVCLQGVNWTRITFKPDLAKFHMTHLDDDVIALMRKRVLDMSALLDVTVQVAFNGMRIRQFLDFMEYAECYAVTSIDKYDPLPSRLGERINDNLEVYVTRSRGTFEQVSFVNKIATTKGGTHVDFVSNLFAQRAAQLWDKYLNYQATVDEVKKHLFILVNVVMENPSFNSPLRDALTSPQESFGSSCELSDSFVYAAAQFVAIGLGRGNSSEDRKASERRG